MSASRSVGVRTRVAAAIALVAIAVMGWSYWCAPSNVVIRLLRMDARPELPQGGGRLTDIVLRGMSSSIVVGATIEVSNENLIAAKLTELTYDIRVNGHPSGQGKAVLNPRGAELEPRAKVPIELETRFPTAKLLSAGMESVSRGDLAVEMEGRAQFSVFGIPLSRDFLFRRSFARTTTLGEILHVAPAGRDSL